MSDNIQMPACRCDECDEMRPIYGFVSLRSERGDESRNLCSKCYNRECTRSAGLPELETVNFEPFTCRDAVGQEHTFYFAVHMSSGLGIRASEWVNDGPGGYQFMVLEPPQTLVRKAHEKLIAKIEAGLAVRYLVSSDFPGAGARQNRLYVKGRAVNGRIDEREDGRPTVVVDGREYSWEEFGEFMSCFTGFNFRLECFDICDNPEITPDPPQRNLVWWLPEQDQTEEDLCYH